MTGMICFRSAARTDVGLVRRNNQDSLVERPAAGLWGVADGMGGHTSGEVASGLVRDALEQLDLKGDADLDFDAVHRRLTEVHDQLRRSGPAHSGSTIVVLLANGRGFTCSWAGDSRLYRWRRGRLERLTRDHSLVQELVDSGTIPPAAAHRHPLSNRITRAVGMGERLELDVVRGTVEPGERYLLSSDGLHGVLTDQVIEKFAAMPDPRAAVDAMLAAVMRAGAPDNVSIVLIAVDGKV